MILAVAPAGTREPGGGDLSTSEEYGCIGSTRLFTVASTPLPRNAVRRVGGEKADHAKREAVDILVHAVPAVAVLRPRHVRVVALATEVWNAIPVGTLIAA